MSAAEIFTLVACTAGVFFFLAGSVGILRFPDEFSRLHALTKADNLGLGLIVLGLVPQLPDAWSIAKLVIVWLLAVLAAATVAQLAARAGLRLSGLVRFDPAAKEIEHFHGDRRRGRQGDRRAAQSICVSTDRPQPDEVYGHRGSALEERSDRP